MTTVGYGDFYPNSALGYILASMCALTGIILMGMPVPLIARNFHSFYGLQFYHSREHRIRHIKYDMGNDSEKDTPRENLNKVNTEKFGPPERMAKKEPKENQTGVELIVTSEKTGEDKFAETVGCALQKRNKLLALFESNKVSPVDENGGEVTQRKRRKSL